MLGKLIKYDLKANRNLFLLMYLVLLGVAVGTRISIGDWRTAFDHHTEFRNVMLVIMLSSYAVSLITVSVLGEVLIIRRFYLNLFGSEGYLSFTLPVTAAQHLISKVITAIIWNVCSLIVQLLSVLILLSGELSEVLMELDIRSYSLFEGVIHLEDLIFSFVTRILGALISLLMIYFAICLGQTMRSRRILCAVVFYFGINFVRQTIGNLLLGSFVRYNTNWMATTLITYETPYYVINIFWLLLQLVLFGVGSVLLMKKKLNLE